MTQSSKPVRYYHEDAVRGMLESATRGREKDVSKFIDPFLTLRPEVAAFAQNVDTYLNDVFRNTDAPDENPAVWVQRKIAAGALFLNKSAHEGNWERVLLCGAQIAADILRFADVMGGLKGE